MQIATFNVNSIRARMPVLENWLRLRNPDIVGLQETKVEDSKFPFEPLQDLGYQIAFHGQQKYNGVAILTKSPHEVVQVGFPATDMPTDCRLLAVKAEGLTIVNSYVPNGSAVGSDKYHYKLEWFRKFKPVLHNFLQDNENTIWMGDINVAPQDIDVYEPDKHRGEVCFSDREKESLADIVSLGLVDCFRKNNLEGNQFSYWEYFIPNAFARNLGWRIDHIYAPEHLANLCNDCIIDREPRTWEKPSDHTPVIASFEMH